MADTEKSSLEQQIEKATVQIEESTTKAQEELALAVNLLGQKNTKITNSKLGDVDCKFFSTMKRIGCFIYKNFFSDNPVNNITFIIYRNNNHVILYNIKRKIIWYRTMPISFVHIQYADFLFVYN